MDFAWNVYGRVSDVVGPEGAVVVLAVLLALALYLVLGSARPSN